MGTAELWMRKSDGILFAVIDERFEQVQLNAIGIEKKRHKLEVVEFGGKKFVFSELPCHSPIFMTRDELRESDDWKFLRGF